MKKKIKIYTDFDATISINDVSDTLFSKYAIDDWKQPIEDWKQGLISSKEVFMKECDITRVTEQQVQEFCDSQPIDPYFKNFIDYCILKNYPITILSDGFDYYIKRILANNGLSFISVRANQVHFEDENRIRPEFPYYGKGCPNCANCKGYHISAEKQDEELIIYIGDGYSDRCGVEQSDIIFAKKDLKKHCIRECIPFYEFQNFMDVLNGLIEIEKSIEKSNLRTGK